MNWVIPFLIEAAVLTAAMAPYLLLGFLVAGLLRSFVTEQWVRAHLGQRGFVQTIKAVVIGIPLPLCSCGVIPVAAGIRRQGGSAGATASFTAATPQTGVDSIAATIGMLGLPFTIIRVLIAFANGIITGVLVDKFGDAKEKQEPAPGETSCCGSAEPKQTESCCSSETDSDGCCSGANANETPGWMDKIRSGMSFGLITLPRELSMALIVGILLAAVISSTLPASTMESIPGGIFGMYTLVTIISLPLYVCSTGSIPMAFSLLHAGITPGAALLFLIAGPATNTATVTSLWKLIGPRSTLLYIFSILAISWISAALTDFTRLAPAIESAVHHHEMKTSPFQWLSALILLGVLVFASNFVQGLFKRAA